MCSDLNCKIDKGLCHCGCGQPAPVAKKTTTRYGHIKGQPIRYINGHYQRSTRLSPVDYVVDAVTGCWIWQRSRLPSGYGQMRYGGRMRRAHRVHYERHRGPIPAGLHLDHLCRNPACVNPTHLEAVTPREHTLRGNTIAARRRAQTHCVRGHPFDDANRGPVPSGLMMDHLCRNRACVNPYHLEPVTAKENAARRDRAKGKRALRVLR
jgi:hypothetical protein